MAARKGTWWGNFSTPIGHSGVDSVTTISLAAFLMLMSAGCATIHKTDVSSLNIVPVPEATSDPVNWEEIARLVSQGNNVVFRISKGQAIPLKTAVNLPMARIEAGQNNIVFTKDTYLMARQTGLWIGPDGQRWADINDIKSVNKLFGSGHGGGSMGFHITKEDGAFISLEVQDSQ